MTKRNTMVLLVLLVIIGGAIGGAIIFLTQKPNASQVALPAVTMADVRYQKLI